MGCTCNGMYSRFFGCTQIYVNHVQMNKSSMCFHFTQIHIYTYTHIHIAHRAAFSYPILCCTALRCAIHSLCLTLKFNKFSLTFLGIISRFQLIFFLWLHIAHCTFEHVSSKTLQFSPYFIPKKI